MAFAGNPIGLWYPIRIPRIPGFEKFWKPTVTLSRSGLALQLAQPKDAVFHAGNHSCSLGVGSAFLEPTSAQGFPERGSGSRLYAEATEAGYPSPITIDQQTGLYFVALAPWEVLLSETILGNHPDQLSSLKAFRRYTCLSALSCHNLSASIHFGYPLSSTPRHTTVPLIRRAKSLCDIGMASERLMTHAG